MPTPTHAVVLGAGSAGTLAASVLTRHLDRVTLVERDPVPDGPEPRKGVPQARHAHLLWSGGARVMESLLPGTMERWAAAGARRHEVPSGLVLLTAQGWLRRWPQMQFLMSCSRDLLDWVVRRQVLRHPRITLRRAARGVSLLGDSERVTGVELRDEVTGEVTPVEADLVVDATGRGSRAAVWLTELGVPEVREVVIDSGLAYATRLFRAPPGARAAFPVVSVQPDHREPRPGQTATLLPIEGGHWLVTLSGTRGGEPPTDEEGFLAFARGVRHPVVGDLIAGAEPISPVHGSRSTANRRRYFERLPRWPEGFNVLGDAVATYNPVYGHGMSVAAHCVAAMHHRLQRHGLAPGTARRVQRAVGRAVDGAWATATCQDVLYPGAAGPGPTAPGRLLQRYIDRLLRTATARPSAADAFLDAITLSSPMTRMLSPKAAWAALLGPGRPALTGPPLMDEERRRLARPCGSVGEA